MAKRSMRSKSRDSAYAQENVHPLFPGRAGWTPHDPDGQFRDRKYVKNIRAMSPAQQQLMDAVDTNSVVLALGPAGTGKTYLAIAKAVEALEAGKVQRIVLSRPAVEAGESLGFLPGDMQEKLAPYLRPLYDALTERLGTKRLKAMLADGIIEIAPVAQRMFRGDRRSPELHLHADQDAADTAGLAFDHGADGRSRPDRSAARHFRAGRHCRKARSAAGRSGGAAGGRRHRAPPAGGIDADRAVNEKAQAIPAPFFLDGLADVEHRQSQNEGPVGRYADGEAVGNARAFLLAE